MAIKRILVVTDCVVFNQETDATDNLAINIDDELDQVILTVDGHESFVEVRIDFDNWFQVVGFVELESRKERYFDDDEQDG